ncbi:NADPH:quinone reductase [Oenococcus oeni]|uniref:quinone oxidoreductase family protein n=1 Tax=Oenococcus oeni TaxID=1247 RepID=UPI0008F920FB|nr:zinc-binding alcohol dehydrogenase family protein [Oenococcus oeni]OIM61560.1 NADPH:quinone reductase [Oenococcus oeni]OLQ32612.1 NADPH:quinone reductase [Oenococcus oeni]
MQSIVQTNFTGIDGLIIRNEPRPALTDNGVLIAMETLPVVPSDWHKETDPNATAEQALQLPRVIGIGGVGTVIEVGHNRDQKLLHQRVLVMHPKGSYQEFILNTNSDWLFPLPINVSNAEAATLTAGPGVALALTEFIKQNPSDHLVITGANSVIGLILCQLLGSTYPGLTPIVSPDSQAYFNQSLPGYPVYSIEHLQLFHGRTLIIYIAGSEPLLQQLIAAVPRASIASIALQTSNLNVPFTFVHEDFNHQIYCHLIKTVASHKLWLPIGRIFSFAETKKAQHYAKDHHSRGRVLVNLN